MSALKHRSFGGKLFRPKPVLQEDENFGVVVTCWGTGDNTVHVAEEIAKYIKAATSDVEVTSPFEYVTGLSDEANYLRIAFMLANDFIFRGENKSSYVSGYEVAAYIYNDKQLAYAQIGGPHLLFKGLNKPIMPLAAQVDLSMESFATSSASPLPSRLLGVESRCQVVCGDIKVSSQDQLLLTSASLLPKALWTDSAHRKVDLDHMTRWMAQEYPEMPFWLGVLDID